MASGLVTIVTPVIDCNCHGHLTPPPVPCMLATLPGTDELPTAMSPVGARLRHLHGSSMRPRPVHTKAVLCKASSNTLQLMRQGGKKYYNSLGSLIQVGGSTDGSGCQTPLIPAPNLHLFDGAGDGLGVGLKHASQVRASYPV